jgi:hypothetical protein
MLVFLMAKSSSGLRQSASFVALLWASISVVLQVEWPNNLCIKYKSMHLSQMKGSKTMTQSMHGNTAVVSPLPAEC